MRGIWITMILAAVLTACAGMQGTSEALPTCLEELAGHTVAVPGGGSTDLLLSQYKGIDLMRVGIGEMALSVKSKRAEYAMMQEDQYDATKMDQQGFRKCFNGILKGSVAVALRTEEEKVRDDFNQFLREMRASGEYDQWHHDWLQNLDSMVVEAVKMPLPREGKQITVGITIVFPYIFLSNETLSGMEVDLFNRFCLSKGYYPKYEIIQFPALIPSLNAHKIDAILSHLTITEERAKQVLFTEDYLESGQCCFGLNPEWEDETGLGLGSRVKESIYQNLIEENRWKLLVNGLITTLEISLMSLLLAIVIGALLCCLRMQSSRYVSVATQVFVNIVRGIPVLVILMIMFYVILAKVRLSGIAVSIFGFGLFFGACFSEVFRSGMMSVDRGQWEAGAAMGLLQLVGLYDKAGNLPSELSGGQKQRAAIARCLAMDPEIILFDEPTSALDPTMVSEVLVVIRRLAREGMTMAIVSHEMQFTRSVSTRVFFMNEGIIYEEGSPEQIFEHPQRPATAAFVNRIRTLEFKLADKHFDFYGILGEVGVFCNKFGLGNNMLMKVQHVMEEMLYQILPFSGPVTLTLDYSEKDFTLRLLFVEDGCTAPVLERIPGYSLSFKLIKGMSSSVRETDTGKIVVEM